MCGFVLLASVRAGRPLPHTDAEIDRLRAELRHRGPDEGRSWMAPDRRVALAHRRLEVLDLEGGRQPMALDGRYHLVYNGEIYNFRELREELRARGRSFTSTGDTEVLLAAFAEWGEACLSRLRGIFAFAVWDAVERRVFLARDPVGVKPLYVGVVDGVLYVASESKAIVADPRVPRRVDPGALELYFHYGYVPAPHAIWEGVAKVPAGHRSWIDLDRGVERPPAFERYWTMPFGRVPVDDIGEGEALERLDETLRAAVRAQMVSDVPLGAFLSGGVDSSLVTLYLAEASRRPVKTFTIGFRADSLDERPWAGRLAERVGAEHREVVLDRLDEELLAELAWIYDEPFGDEAALPTAMLGALAREEVTVVLSGDGGDETHAGYPRYLRMDRLKAVDRVPLALRRLLFGPVARAAPSFWRRGGPEQLCRGELARYDAMTRKLPRVHRWQAYSDDFRASLHAVGRAPADEGPAGWRRRVAEQAPDDAPVVERYQLLDLASYLPEQLMTKLDRATMRVGLEARVPLLDTSAIDLAARIPTSLRTRRGTPKYLLRRLLATKMGDDFVDRPKHGFSLPSRSWLRSLGPERVTEMVFTDGVEEWLDRDRLGGMLHHGRGAELVWPFLMFSYWHRAYRPEPPR